MPVGGPGSGTQGKLTMINFINVRISQVVYLSWSSIPEITVISLITIIMLHIQLELRFERNETDSMFNFSLSRSTYFNSPLCSLQYSTKPSKHHSLLVPIPKATRFVSCTGDNPQEVVVFIYPWTSNLNYAVAMNWSLKVRSQKVKIFVDKKPVTMLFVIPRDCRTYNALGTPESFMLRCCVA